MIREKDNKLLHNNNRKAWKISSKGCKFLARCQQLKITSQRWPFSLTANIFWWSQKLYFKRYFWFRERANSVAPVTLDKPLMRPFPPNFKLIKLQQHKRALDTDFLYKSTLFYNGLSLSFFKRIALKELSLKDHWDTDQCL